MLGAVGQLPQTKRYCLTSVLSLDSLQLVVLLWRYRTHASIGAGPRAPPTAKHTTTGTVVRLSTRWACTGGCDFQVSWTGDAIDVFEVKQFSSALDKEKISLRCSKHTI